MRLVVAVPTISQTIPKIQILFPSMSIFSEAASGSRERDDDETSPSPDRVEAWIDRYGDSLFRYAMAKTHDVPVAEDLVQDTFVAVVQGQKSFRNESTVSTWLFAILRRKIADHFRSSQRAQERFEQQVDISQRAEARRVWDSDPAAICEDRDFQVSLNQCIDKLPNKYAEAFIMRELNQQTPKEICEVLGLSATNLSMRLHRGRLAIRDCLNANWFGEKPN